MSFVAQPAQRVGGTITLPGDKSISHRYAMLSAIGEGSAEITNYSTGADCASTLDCLEAMGVKIRRNGTTISIEGVGMDGLRKPAHDLDVGNSGTLIRLIAGILAGQSFTTVMAGDESIAQRPMKRIMTPLIEMGAKITARDGEFPPLTIEGSKLHAVTYAPPVASAQVKSATLLGGLYAEGTTVVREKLKTRDHTEIALREMGADIEVSGLEIRLKGRPTLKNSDRRVASDLSSATFFICAALMLPGSDLTIEGVGLNPTRTDLLDVLLKMGADIEIIPDEGGLGERTGTLRIRGVEGGIKGGVIEGAVTAGVIDEIPMLSVLGALSRDGLDVRDARELRVKETDRIATVADNLGRMGVEVAVREDGMTIPGGQTLKPAKLDSFGDHRIAMAFTVAALAAEGPCEIVNAEAASVSFPEFFETLDAIR